MLGKLTIDALPFYSDIAIGGALITVLGALGVVALISWLGQWRYLWTEWLTSLDHKKIGIMYVTLALIMLVRGFIITGRALPEASARASAWRSSCASTNCQIEFPANTAN